MEGALTLISHGSGGRETAALFAQAKMGRSYEMPLRLVLKIVFRLL